MHKTAFSLLLITFGLAIASSQAAPAAEARPAAAPSVTVAAPTAQDSAAKVSPPGDTAKASGDTLKSGVTAAPTTADSAGPAVDTARAAAAPTPDSLAAPADAVAAAEGDTMLADTARTDSVKAPPARKKRKLVVRETTVNTIDELKGRYRSPKKALFMSLLVPGLGQAYVGQHWANYTRGAAYLFADVGLVLGWRHYVGTKQDRQIARYRVFADSNWSHQKYEDSIAVKIEAGKFDARFPHRESYCNSVQSQVGTEGAELHKACVEPYVDANEYLDFRDELRDADWSTDSVSRRRAQFPDQHEFYELIGKQVEFIHGWLDADDIQTRDSTFVQIRDGQEVTATTPLQQRYIGMRGKANEYARMQAWFLGGMVLNHIVSALDAALTAHYHNKSLYQTDLGFWDRLRLDSHMAWDGYGPRPGFSASVTF